MHEHDLDFAIQKHDYMNLEELEKLEHSLPTDIKRKESMSSASTTSDLDLPEEPKHDREGSKDSFYDSEKEDLSFNVNPVKAKSLPDPIKETPSLKTKPVVKTRPVPLPRKHDSLASATSYENEEAIEEMKAHEEFIKEKQQLQNEAPSRAELDSSFDYENIGLSITDVKQTQSSNHQKEDSIEVFQYENSSLAPLPSYEEAVQGDAEFFNMDDLEAPPVPKRNESNLVMPRQSEENQIVSELSSDEVRRIHFICNIVHGIRRFLGSTMLDKSCFTTKACASAAQPKYMSEEINMQFV